jgi:hypothetical protein
MRNLPAVNNDEPPIDSPFRNTARPRLRSKSPGIPQRSIAIPPDFRPVPAGDVEQMFAPTCQARSQQRFSLRGLSGWLAHPLAGFRHHLFQRHPEGIGPVHPERQGRYFLAALSPVKRGAVNGTGGRQGVHAGPDPLPALFENPRQAGVAELVLFSRWRPGGGFLRTHLLTHPSPLAQIS